MFIKNYNDRPISWQTQPCLQRQAHPQPGDSYVQSFARGLEVIRSFSAHAPQQTLSEVARAAA
jgi:IclR family pca regulon transcriptional regulator